MHNLTLTRKELYDLVWSEPMSKIALQFNITDNGLRKICERMAIPIPKNGYWQKIQYNKKVSITPLPVKYSGEATVTLRLREEGLTTNIKHLQQELENNPDLSFNVPDKLSSPHPLVIAARESLEEKRESYRYKGIIYTYGDTLNIKVSLTNIGRALRFMDTLIKALDKRGFKIEFKYDKTYIVAEKDEIEIILREKTKKVTTNDRWNSTEYHVNGILSLETEAWFHRNEWKDGTASLEKQLPKIFAKLELIFINLQKERLNREQRQKEQEEKRLIEEKIRNRKKKELEDFKQLLNNSKRHQTAVNIRYYINDMEKQAILNNSLSNEVNEWIKWARKKADWYDPLTETEDDLLGKCNNEILSILNKSPSDLTYYPQ